MASNTFRSSPAAAIQPSVRAVAYQCLMSGKATWTVGFEWAWIDKVYGLRRRMPKLETREVQRTDSVAETIKEAIRDKSNVVRIVRTETLISKTLRLKSLREYAATRGRRTTARR